MEFSPHRQPLFWRYVHFNSATFLILVFQVAPSYFPTQMWYRITFSRTRATCSSNFILRDIGRFCLEVCSHLLHQTRHVPGFLPTFAHEISSAEKTHELLWSVAGVSPAESRPLEVHWQLLATHAKRRSTTTWWGWGGGAECPLTYVLWSYWNHLHVCMFNDFLEKYKIFAGKLERKWRPLVRPERRGQNNVDMLLQEIGCEVVDLIKLA